MLAPKEKVFDRIEQSFYLFKKNFTQIFLPLFIYKIFTTGFIFSFIFYFLLKIIDFSYLDNNLQNTTGISYDFFLQNLFLFFIFCLFFIGYFFLIIPFYIGTIKAIKNSYFEVDNNFRDNIKYGFSRFFSIFKIYWYIFSYVFLVPALFFIFGSLMLIFGYIYQINNLLDLGFSILYFSIILFLVFFLYRGVQTTFSLYSAIDKDKFDKENFENSIELTNNNWWRIIGNMLLISLLLSLIIGLFLNIFSFFIDFGNNNIFNSNGLDKKELIIYLNNLKNFNFLEFIKNLINIFTNSFFEIFMYVFIYIFYKRIELEKNSDISSKEFLKVKEKDKIMEL